MKELLSFFILPIFLLICSAKITFLKPNVLGKQTLKITILKSNVSSNQHIITHINETFIKAKRPDIYHNWANDHLNYNLDRSDNLNKLVPCYLTNLIKTILKVIFKYLNCCHRKSNSTQNKIYSTKKGCNLIRNQLNFKLKCCHKVKLFSGDRVVYMITITLAKLIIIIIAYQQLLHNGYIIISNLYYKRIRQCELLLCNKQYQQDGHGLGDEESYLKKSKPCQRDTSLNHYVKKKWNFFKEICNIIENILNKSKGSSDNIEIRNYSSVRKKQKSLMEWKLSNKDHFKFYYKSQHYNYFETSNTKSYIANDDGNGYKQHRCVYRRDNPCYQGYYHQVEENIPIEAIQNVKTKVTFNSAIGISIAKRSVVTAQIRHTHIISRIIPSLNTLSSTVCHWKILNRKCRKRKGKQAMDDCNYFITNKSSKCSCMLCNISCDVFSRCQEYFHFYSYKMYNHNAYGPCCSCYCFKRINSCAPISRATALNYNFFKNKVGLSGNRSSSFDKTNMHHINIINIAKSMRNAPLQPSRQWCLDTSNSEENETDNSNNLLSSLNAVKAITTAVQSRNYKRKLKNNLVWLFIGLVWLEGPKLINCSISHHNNDITSVKGNETTNKINNNQNSNSSSSGSRTDTNSGGNSDGRNSNTNGPGPNLRPNASENKDQNVKSENVIQTSDTFVQQRNSNSINYSKNRITVNELSIEVPLQKKKKNPQIENQLSFRKTQRQPYPASRSILNYERPTTIRLVSSVPENEEVNRAQSDLVRLESIKQQILSKLGLTEKPNVTHPLPKQFIWDTIYRADGLRSVSDFDFGSNHRIEENMRFTTTVSRAPHELHYYSTVRNNVDNVKSTEATHSRVAGNSDSKKYVAPNRDTFNSSRTLNKTIGYRSKNEEQILTNHQLRYKQKQHKNRNNKYIINQYKSGHSEQDSFEGEDFFGSTREIITFAEKGTIYKKHRLVEFSPPSNKYPKQTLQIRNAEIHIRIEKVAMHLNQDHLLRNTYSALREPKLKIWVFQLMGNDFSGKGFDQVATLCTSLSVDHNTLGWQKLDITETVQFWYSKDQKDKLRLLIDCTGCGNRYILHLFDKRFHQSLWSQTTITTNQELNRLQKNLKPLEKTKSERSYYNYKQYNLHQYKPDFDSESTHFKKKVNASKIQIHKYRNVRNIKKTNSSLNEREGISYKIGGEYHTEDRLNPNRPFLVLHTEPIRSRRVRRRAVDCSGAFHGQCCKESFYVSFKALGWDDWIIAPRGYFANYCRGDCTGPYRTPDTFQTFHAHFIEEYRKMGLLNGMQPCCAPVKFSSMSLIYYGDDGIIKRDLPKMVVDECGCP